MKNNLKIALFLMIFIALIFTLSFCKEADNDNISNNNDIENDNNSDSSQSLTVNIAAPLGTPAIVLSRIVVNKKITDDIDVDFQLLNGPAEIPVLLKKQSIDLMFMPINLAAKLYNTAEINYKLFNVIIWGSFHILTTDKNINNIDDLVGKDLYLFGKGASPDILTRFFLKTNGISPDDDLNLIYKQTNQNAQLLIANKIKTALFSEPVATQVMMKNDDVISVVDYNKEWSILFGNDISITQAGFIINNDFTKKNPEIVSKIESALKKELSEIVSNPEEFATYSVENNFFPNKEVIINSVEKLNLNYKSSIQAKNEVENYLQILLDSNPKSVGGKLPVDDFFYYKQ